MRKTEVEKTLEYVGIKARDDKGHIRSAEDLTKDVMDLLNRCDKENGARLLMALAIAKRMDDDGF